MKHDAKELLYQWYETELGGVQIYTTALKCVQNDDLKEEWEKYLDQTKHHVEVVEQALADLEMELDLETPGRAIVRHKGESLVKAMEMALANATPAGAELVACECVVDGETKDHQNWHLIAELAKKETGDAGRILKAAVEEVEDEEDEHLYHTKGWCRELWLDSMGIPAVLPPPEEEKKVKTAIGAARAEHARTELL